MSGVKLHARTVLRGKKGVLISGVLLYNIEGFHYSR